MAEKRFELTMSGSEVAQYEIIDHSQEILTVYNNLGNVYFSSAMKICELLNSLADENKQLKQKIISLEDARYSYKQDWKQASADCELYKDEIDLLKDENKGLIKENEQLKQILNELSNMLQFDVENGIRSYPVKLSEYLSNALKEL